MHNTWRMNFVYTSTPAQDRDHVIAGPITRARARQLNHQVSSLLSSYSSYLDCGDTCTLVLIRNHGQDRKGEGEGEGEGLARADSDCRQVPTSDGRHGRIRSRIGAFKYSLEP